MRKIYLTALALSVATLVQAQDTYLNERLMNSTGELYGSARYVGMGGAMGALGADISCMSYNPAGIGLYRRSDIAITAGAIWNNNPADRLKNSTATLDQLGFVYSARTQNEDIPFFNIGFNYQKKMNYSHAFFADNDNIKGLSQMDQLAELASFGMDTDYNLAGAAVDYQFLNPVTNNNNQVVSYYNKYGGNLNRYTQRTWGNLKSYDTNLSLNINDRVYAGVTVGFDRLNYRAESDYYEESSVNEGGEIKAGNYSLYNNYKIDGWGFNMKFGVIVRPFEDHPLRVGVAFETPTWYQLSSSTLYHLTDEVDHEVYPNFKDDQRDNDESYLDYSLRSPVKGRFSVGSTVGTFLAWNVDYELANYGYNRMGFPNSYNYDGTARLWNNTPEYNMNEHTKNTLGLQHSVRAGMEYKPNKHWAFRMGYNFSSSPYKDGATFDQLSIGGDNNLQQNSAISYLTSTSYMKTGASHTLTLGAGYKFKTFYIDLAYKVRRQMADFYAFDTSFTNPDSDFSKDNPSLTNSSLSPVEVALGRQQLTCTMGFKF